MSRSLGTVVDPLEAADRFGPDPLRLFLTREMPFGQDGDFSWERFEERYNADLANNLGNLVSRLVSMAGRYRQGRLARPAHRAGDGLQPASEEAVGQYHGAMDELRLQDAVGAAFDLIDSTNEFITSTEPWVLSRDAAKASQLDAVLYDAADALRIAAILLSPAMPRSAREILGRLGVDEPAEGWRLDHVAAPGAAGDLVTRAGDALWPRLEAKHG
jgi:methionyl-tRNA synthetase